MEDRGAYAVGQRAYVRAVCLLPYESWEVPTKDELRSMMDRAGLDPRQVADLVGVSRKEVNRWTLGTDAVPFACWVLLCQRAAAGYLEGVSMRVDDESQRYLGALKARELAYLEQARAEMADDLLADSRNQRFERLNGAALVLHRIGLLSVAELDDQTAANLEAKHSKRRLLG
ncbi:hypothetical protein LZ023_40815 (plasmid) [Pseudomonas silvicola]|nr:hypothetical protein LZ023_41090 [Pseudomonas silvicola]WAH62278.1 hypothetical protein LZ023_40815 [Pseudomonas silvicola]